MHGANPMPTLLKSTRFSPKFTAHSHWPPALTPFPRLKLNKKYTELAVGVSHVAPCAWLTHFQSETCHFPGSDAWGN